MFAANAFQILQSGTVADPQDPDGGNISDPIRHLAFSLLDVGRLYARRFQERARELALDLMQCRAVLTLAGNQGITQQRLAELIGLDPAALGRTLNRLETSGWVERRPYRGDRRARSLVLTQQAWAFVPLIGRIVAESQVAALKGFSGEETYLLVAGLKQIVANLRASEPGADAAPVSHPQDIAS